MPAVAHVIHADAVCPLLMHVRHWLAGISVTEGACMAEGFQTLSPAVSPAGRPTSKNPLVALQPLLIGWQRLGIPGCTACTVLA